MAEFPPQFWESLRRVKAAPKQYSHDVYWFPTSDVYDFREYERDADLSRGTGYGRERVDELADDLRLRGQQEPAVLSWFPDAYGKSFGIVHLSEGNHRVAALRNRLDMPYALAALDRSGRMPNLQSEAPEGVRRGVIWQGQPGPGNYYPKHPDPNEFRDFRKKTILPSGLPGSPDDRAMVKALGNPSAARRIVDAMARAGRVFGPAAGVVGVIAGLNDPAEALGATVDRAGDTNWAKKKVTPQMKRQERRYYDQKRKAERARNPLTSLIDGKRRGANPMLGRGVVAR